MEANDLNKSSQEQVNLDSENISENKKEENLSPVPGSENEGEATQNTGTEIPEEKAAEPEKSDNAEATDSNESTASENEGAASEQESEPAPVPPESTDQSDDKSIKNEKITRQEPVHPKEVDYSALSRKELLKHYHYLLEEFPASGLKGHVEAIRKEFERKSASELAGLKQQFIASGEPAEAFSPPHDDLSDAIQNAIQQFRKKRDEERKQQEETKKKNLAAKYEVIEGINDLINRQESLHHTFDDFRTLQQRWREIGPVPQQEVHDMWENYHLHVENFYNYIKINKELRDLDLKKNYETKIGLCEKTEKLLLEPSIVKAFKTLQKYHDQWRETGPVPKEQKDELWERFRESTVKINQKHQEYFEEQKEQLQKNLEAKTELCQKVEAIANQDLKSPGEWEKNSKALIDLQQLWKTIGFAPKKENQEIYMRFRSACDQFFDNKRDFFKRYKEEQQNNLQLKNELVQQSEDLKESTDWKNTTDELIRIQKKWKETGPVPRKHSDAIWKHFRGACDQFFNRKSEFFSKKDEIQEQNLKLKEALIDELKNYEPGENNEESFKTLQRFQHRWSEIGFLPIN
jgi:hypothetical protein